MQFKHVKGVDTILKNMRSNSKSMARRFELGLKRGGRFLLRESLLFVPVQTGDLRASAFIRAFSDGFTTDVVVGYTAKYAVYVHENIDAAHGGAFNIKYADLIAGRTGRAKKAKQAGRPHNVITDPYFKRGENQQAKFLEGPARVNRKKILRIVADEILRK